ncbi:hypothetical protein [Streptomyces sp. NPDC013457]|uniref:hypothetical protein n=1 Tax=Streptomyces sp. NPDC013457 TaxID=3364866 RepID=UPI003700A67D
MLAYAVHPAWETPRLRGRLADWLVAGGRYAASVVAHCAQPAGTACPDVREALLDTRGPGSTGRRRWSGRGAKAVRERRALDWGEVREAVAAWGPDDDLLLSRGSALLLDALDDMAEALAEDGSARGTP